MSLPIPLLPAGAGHARCTIRDGSAAVLRTCSAYGYGQGQALLAKPPLTGFDVTCPVQLLTRQQSGDLTNY
jgi:hypothetical protein